jgi:hypothetical protein
MSFFYPDPLKMSASTSTPANHKFTFPVIETGTSITIDSITQLTGAENYQTWEIQVAYMFNNIDAEEIVLENL